MTEIYSVVLFGCESTGAMRIPETYLFTNREKAYEFYRAHAPDLDDPYNRAEEYEGTHDEWEAIVQLTSYHAYNSEDWMKYAKRPEGAVISKHIVS